MTIHVEGLKLALNHGVHWGTARKTGEKFFVPEDTSTSSSPMRAAGLMLFCFTSGQHPKFLRAAVSVQSTAARWCLFVGAVT